MIADDGRLANWVTECSNALGNLRPSWSKKYTFLKLSHNSKLQDTSPYTRIEVIWLFPPVSWQLIAFLGYNIEKLLKATEEGGFKKVFKLLQAWHAIT